MASDTSAKVVEKYKVGQKLWLVPSLRPSDACEVTITSVGHKYAYFKRWKHTECRIEHGSVLVDTNGVDSARVWLSRDDYEVAKARRVAWQEFRQDVQHEYTLPSEVTAEDVELARELLRLPRKAERG